MIDPMRVMTGYVPDPRLLRSPLFTCRVTDWKAVDRLAQTLLKITYVTCHIKATGQTVGDYPMNFKKGVPT